VTAGAPETGTLNVIARRAADYLLRPPAWADRDAVKLLRDGVSTAATWGGAGDAYVLCRKSHPDERLTLNWPVPRFTQNFVPTSVPGRTAVTVDWVGNTVVNVTPRVVYLPMRTSAEK